jgi:isomerase DpgB
VVSTELSVDGTRPISAALITEVMHACDQAEDQGGSSLLTVYVTGTPGADRAADLTVGLVSKWERAVRRLERLPAATVAVASGDCGGVALDVLVATDLRIAAPGTRLLVPVDGESTWPGMFLYRLGRQSFPGAIRRAVLLGGPIDAAAALRAGLIDEVTDQPATAVAALDELASQIVGKEMAIRRQLAFDASRTSFEDALGSHLAACDRALRRGARA